MEISVTTGHTARAVEPIIGTRHSVSEYIREDSLPKLMALLTAYYEYLNSTIGRPSYEINNLTINNDVDLTSEYYLDAIGKLVAANIPNNTTSLDKRRLYKIILDYYLRRGSDHSIADFFKIFYDELATIFFPKDFIFKIQNSQSDDKNQSLISDAFVLQDSYYWQEFSYAINSEFPKENWINEYLRFVHPAGLKLFVKLSILLVAYNEWETNPNQWWTHLVVDENSPWLIPAGYTNFPGGPVDIYNTNKLVVYNKDTNETEVIELIPGTNGVNKVDDGDVTLTVIELNDSTFTIINSGDIPVYNSQVLQEELDNPGTHNLPTIGPTNDPDKWIVIGPYIPICDWWKYIDWEKSTYDEDGNLYYINIGKHSPVIQPCLDLRYNMFMKLLYSADNQKHYLTQIRNRYNGPYSITDIYQSKAFYNFLSLIFKHHQVDYINLFHDDFNNTANKNLELGSVEEGYDDFQIENSSRAYDPGNHDIFKAWSIKNIKDDFVESSILISNNTEYGYVFTGDEISWNDGAQTPSDVFGKPSLYMYDNEIDIGIIKSVDLNGTSREINFYALTTFKIFNNSSTTLPDDAYFIVRRNDDPSYELHVYKHETEEVYIQETTLTLQTGYTQTLSSNIGIYDIDNIEKNIIFSFYYIEDPNTPQNEVLIRSLDYRWFFTGQIEIINTNILNDKEIELYSQPHYETCPNIEFCADINPNILSKILNYRSDFDNLGVTNGYFNSVRTAQTRDVILINQKNLLIGLQILDPPTNQYIIGDPNYDKIEYLATIINITSSQLTDIKFSSANLNPLIFDPNIAPNDPSWTYLQGEINIGDLAPDEIKQVYFQYQMPYSQYLIDSTFLNHIIVDANEFNGLFLEYSNEVRVTHNINLQSGMIITLEETSSGPYNEPMGTQPGDAVSYKITLTNIGVYDQTNVYVKLTDINGFNGLPSPGATNISDPNNILDPNRLATFTPGTSYSIEYDYYIQPEDEENVYHIVSAYSDEFSGQDAFNSNAINITANQINTSGELIIANEIIP